MSILRFTMLPLLMMPWQAIGSHASGSDIHYRCVSGLKYEVEVSFYRDCGGVSEPSSIAINCMSLSAGFSQNITAQKIGASTNGQEVTVPCNAVPTQCNGGNTGGIRRWVYRATVTLPSRRSDWVFSYSVCCRNCVITTISNPCAANTLLYVEATLDNLNVQSNDSPRFNRVPVAYVCTGQTFRYNHGAVDADGDSLVYELIAPKTTRNSNVSFLFPYSATQPMASSPPLVLDPVTGDLNLTPAQIQVAVMAIRVKEYRQGVLIGSVIRDMQIHSQPCSNILPAIGGIDGTGVFNTSGCAGDTLRFQVPSFDPDSLQVVTLSTDLDIPGASFSITNAARPVLVFEWVPSPLDVRPEPYRFTVAVRDNACPYNGVQVYTFQINLDFPTFQVYTTPVSCVDSSNGTAAAVSPIASGVTYEWSTGSTSPTIQGLQSGTYTVTVTSTANGCRAERSAMVQDAVPLVADLQVSPASCPTSNDASVHLIVQGGAQPVQAEWFQGAAHLPFQPVIPGTYVLRLTDSSGCRFDTTFTIGFDYQLVIDTTVVHNRCRSDSSGSIALNPTNGQLPYTYVWSTGDSSASLVGLDQGDYHVTVTDHVGCIAFLSISIDEPEDSITITGQVHHADCWGDSSGRVEIQVNGAQGPFDIMWNNGTNGPDLINVPAGVYSVVVIDSAGCRAYASYTVEEPLSVISIASIVRDVDCTGDSSGSVTLVPSGGNPPYSIQWGNGHIGPFIGQLTSGSYTAVITDFAGCKADSTFVVGQPVLSLSLQSVSSAADCLNGTSGQIVIHPSGGTSPYALSWSHGGADTVLSAPAGQYTVEIIDSKGCSIKQDFTIVDSSVIEVFAEGDPVICPGSPVKLRCSARPQASLQWYFNGAPLIGATADFFVTSAPGFYSVRVLSECGEYDSKPLEIIARTSPQVSVSNDVILCPGETTRLQVFGGSSYRWFPEEGLDDVHSASPSATPASTTSYTVWVSDEHGCTASASVTVTVLCDEPSVPNGFSPNGDGKNDTFFIDGLDDYPENVIHIYNRWGSLVFKEKPYGNNWNGQANVNGTLMGQELPNGTYFYLLDLGMNRKPVQGFVYLKRE